MSCKGRRTKGAKLQYKEIDEFKVPLTFNENSFRSGASYKPQKDDIIVASYPKCGNTWVSQIIRLVLNKGVPPITAKEYFAGCPFLELAGKEGVKRMPRPGCIKTHLDRGRLSFSKEAKYIVVARHPADCVVSYYHHTQFFPTYFYTNKSFDDFFDCFLSGDIFFNDYFDHLLSWYEVKTEPNVFLTTYENMKADGRSSIFRLAEFLGSDYLSSLESDGGKISDDVLRYSGIEYMKATVNEFYRETFALSSSKKCVESNSGFSEYFKVLKSAVESGYHSIGSFIRSGSVGEGKTTLTEDQWNRLNARITEKTANSDVMELWGNTSKNKS